LFLFSKSNCYNYSYSLELLLKLLQRFFITHVNIWAYISATKCQWHQTVHHSTNNTDKMNQTTTDQSIAGTSLRIEVANLLMQRLSIQSNKENF